MPEQGGGRLVGRRARVQVAEVFHAHLDHVGAAQDAREPGLVGGSVGDRARAAVGVDHHERARGQPGGDQALDAGRDRFHGQRQTARVQCGHARREGGLQQWVLQRSGGGPGQVEAVPGCSCRVEVHDGKGGRGVGWRRHRQDHAVLVEAGP